MHLAAIPFIANCVRQWHHDRMTKTGFDALMEVVCPGYGFCGCIKDGESLHVTMLIPPDGPVTADQFVEWVFLADNMNPNSEPECWQRHKDDLRAAFVEHMGSEVVDAKRLRWTFASDDEEVDAE